MVRILSPGGGAATPRLQGILPLLSIARWQLLVLKSVPERPIPASPSRLDLPPDAIAPN